MNLTVALAGNPNVGKSTVFNALTGMNQHTGNWPGKTVETARGEWKRGDTTIHLVDLPGCYSLLAHSEEEEVARDFICFEHPDAVIAVCDATCLERNMNLVLQIMETTPKLVLCVNLLDEAKKKNISVNLDYLSETLGIPVIGTSARDGKGLDDLYHGLIDLIRGQYEPKNPIRYPAPMESAIGRLEQHLKQLFEGNENHRWMAIRLLEGNDRFLSSMKQYLGFSLSDQPDMGSMLSDLKQELAEEGIKNECLPDIIAETFVKKSEEIASRAVTFRNPQYAKKDRRLDRLFTSKKTGFPILFVLLLLIFWITISGANLPSALLSDGLFWIEDRLVDLALTLHIPEPVYAPILFGVYRVLAWVISVMLPPMAIFFPLFTLLEDFGYLPRVAFNLDRCFQTCHACGKQALTMCMGFGCNAAGVTGCRIIDSPRERMIAILTNNFVPCNGRFPTLIAILSMFITGSAAGFFSSFLSAFSLTLVIVLGVFLTFLVSWILSKTTLKGMPSSFALELPPYRKPQVGKVIVRSVFDRTILVLIRAVSIAAPAGLLLWIMANITVGDATLLNHCTRFLDPFARLLGLDGVILTAFILGMPANEIVMPIMLMAYLAQGSIVEMEDLNVIKSLLSDNGWTWITAVSTVLFSLMHWPCTTTCLTIRKETGSIRWMLVAGFIPTLTGIVCCFLFATIARFLTGTL